MSTPVRLIIAVLLVGVGAFAVPAYHALFPPEEAWIEQMRRDIQPAVQVLQPDPRLPAELSDDFYEKWDARLDLYDAEHRLEFRKWLHLFLSFIEVEYADAAEVWDTGLDPKHVSETALELRAQVRELFGAFGESLIEDYDQMREMAYRASPAHSGPDEGGIDYRSQYIILREWLPTGRERADRLTTPRDQR